MFFITKEITLLIISALPIIELRGAIPVGILQYNMNPYEVLVLSVIGSTLPSPFLIILFKKLIHRLEKIKCLEKLVVYQKNRVLKKAQKLKKSKIIGLILLVAIPIPSTGAWTGSMVASLLDMRLKIAIPCILLGNIIAGIIVLNISHLV
ncbi:small multi-drug export protein [Peptostreptococcaceae bacterium AGR-M142]